MVRSKTKAKLSKEKKPADPLTLNQIFDEEFSDFTVRSSQLFQNVQKTFGSVDESKEPAQKKSKKSTKAKP